MLAGLLCLLVFGCVAHLGSLMLVFIACDARDLVPRTLAGLAHAIFLSGDHVTIQGHLGATEGHFAVQT